MPNNPEWYKTIKPVQIEASVPDTQKICSRVLEQLPYPAERNETMKQKKLSRRIRPLIFAAAAIGVGAVSLVTANAATDGALFSKVTMYINGKEVEATTRLVEQDDDTAIYEIVGDDGEADGENNTGKFRIQEKDNGDISVEMYDMPDSANENSEIEVEMEIETAD